MDPFYGVTEEFRGAVEVQFFLYVGTMSFDCTDAQMQFSGDLACAASLTEQTINFELAVAQCIDIRNSGRGMPLGHLMKHSVAHPFA